MMNTAVASRNAFASEMKRLRTQLSEWFWPQEPEDVPDETWAEAVLEKLEARGFVLIEKVTHTEVLVCLGRKGIIHVSRAPTRPLAIARTVRQFADNTVDAELLLPAEALT